MAGTKAPLVTTTNKISLFCGKYIQRTYTLNSLI